MTQIRTRTIEFVHELRRRRVFRVLLAYAGFAFIVAQVAELLLPALTTSDVVYNWVIRLLVLFFPIAMILAWVFDITPAGLRRTPSMDEGAERQIVARTTPPRERLTNAIATLPFANMSGDPNLDYFSDGITEELITRLSQVRGLRVAARTSCFAVRKMALDVREVGDRLGVRYVTEGSVRVNTNRVMLSVRLVDVEDGYTVWSESYARPLDEIFAIQDEIAQAIATRVVSPAATSRPSVHATRNVQALQMYMQGRYCMNRRTEPELHRAIDFFERAAQLEPEYAVAHAGLADAHAILLDYGLLSPMEALDRARAAAETALRLDPNAAETHTSLALVREFEWRWADAEAAFREAIRLGPEYPVAHQRFALHLAWVGRHDEALEEARTAERLDPLSPTTSSTVGWVLYYARRYEEAVEQLERTLAAEPDFATARIALARARLERGEIARSIADHERAFADAAQAPSMLALLGCAYGMASRHHDARIIGGQLERQARTRYVSPYYLALPHIGLGEYDRALDHLESGLRTRAAQMVYLRAEPLLDPLRGDERFASLRRSLAL